MFFAMLYLFGAPQQHRLSDLRNAALRSLTMNRTVLERDTTDATVTDPLVSTLDRKWGDLRFHAARWGDEDPATDPGEANSDLATADLLSDLMRALGTTNGTHDESTYEYHVYGVFRWFMRASSPESAICKAETYSRAHGSEMSKSLAVAGLGNAATVSPLAFYLEDALDDLPLCANPVPFHRLLGDVVTWITDEEASVGVRAFPLDLASLNLDSFDPAPLNPAPLSVSVDFPPCAPGQNSPGSAGLR
jgi:hypothetical protein